MIILIWSSLAAVLAILCFVYLKWQATYWSRQNIVGPKPMPIFGNMFQYFAMKKHFGEIYDDLYTSHPGAAYVGFYKFGVPSILVRSLDFTKSVLMDNFQSFQANDAHLEKHLDPLLSMNPFFVRGDEWKSKRSQLTPIFTAAKVKAIFPLVADICDRFVSYIDKKSTEGEEFEARHLCSKFTIESVASCAFGLEAEAFSDKESSFVENTRKIFEISTLQAIRLAATFFLPVISRMLKLSYLPSGVDHWLRSIIRQVVKQRDEKQERRSDFLQAVIDMRDRKGTKIFDEVAIVGHSLSFLTDGYETSSGLMAYCLYQLAVNPHIQRKVQEEVDAALLENDGVLTEESVKNLRYTENVINEALRLHTPDFSLNKVCTKEIELPAQYGDGMSGVVIKAGTPVIIPVYSLHRNPEIWNEPLKFDPDRFEDEAKQNRHKCAYLAFGEGPRMCPGVRFGMMQSKAAIAMILSKLNVQLSPKTVEPLTFSKVALMLTCEDGIWLRFLKRQA